MTELLITIRGRVVRTAPDRHSKAAATALAALEGPK